MLFLLLEKRFAWAAWNLFDVGNQSVPTHLASTIPFGSFQCSFSTLLVLFLCSLQGVKTRPHHFHTNQATIG